MRDRCLHEPLMGLLARAGMAEQRRRLVAGARGRVLDVGEGSGRNLALYRDVASVVVLEPDGAVRRGLLSRAEYAAVPVEVVDSAIERSGLADGSFDTVLATLAMCSVASQAAALDEVCRLLAPGGRFLFLEHVRSPGTWGRLQAAATPLWSRLAAGCHLDRSTLDAVRTAGLAVTDCDRSGVLVLGSARVACRPALAPAATT